MFSALSRNKVNKLFFASSAIKVLKKEIKEMDNLTFYKYWMDNFIIKNKQLGRDIQKLLRVSNDFDKLYTKILNYESK